MQKSYLLWPYLKELKTVVTRSFKEEDAYFVELERTLFYPHLAGGQPEDRGWIDGIRVLHVREKDGRIEHQVEEEMQEGDATLTLDWDRRYDHMQQHTAQHIISGVLTQLFAIDTVGFMIGESVSTIDIDAQDREDIDEVLQTVEQQANRLCVSALPIRYRFVPNAPKKAKAGDAPIRRISIPTIAETDCGGTHVSNTAEVGLIRIARVQKDRGHLRLTYIAGGRCEAEYRHLLEQAETWARTYQTSTMESFDRVQTQLDRIEPLLKENKQLLRLAMDGARLSLAERVQNKQGQRHLVAYINHPLPLKELAEEIRADLLLLVDCEGALYIRTSQPRQAVMQLVQSWQKSGKFHGGGKDREWYGRFAEGPFESLPEKLWRSLRDFGY